MLTVILIATIIHMNMGYELGEAIARGIGSAAIIAGASIAICFLVVAIVYIVGCLIEKH